MKTSIQQGATLVTQSTKQFKTTLLAVDFAAPLLKRTVSARALVATLLEASSARYPSVQALSRQLEQLYGARFNVQTLKYGKTHHIRLQLEFPNVRLVGADQVLGEAIEFLRQQLFEPQLDDSKTFNQATFDRERTNLVQELNSRLDDKQYVANQKIRQLYFSDPAMAIPADGEVDQLTHIDNAAVKTVYDQMLNQDQVTIAVNGDIDESVVQKEFEKWPFTNRSQTPLTYFYRQGRRPVALERQEHYPVQQAKFNLAYMIQSDPNSSDRFTAVVLNALFGGSFVSGLFTHVREELHLAYVAQSQWSNLTGVMFARTGIDPNHFQAANQAIGHELIALQQTPVDEDRLRIVKDELHNSYDEQLDNQHQQLERQLTQELFNLVTTPNMWHEQIEQVDAAAIQQLARQTYIQATYFLTNESHSI